RLPSHERSCLRICIQNGMASICKVKRRGCGQAKRLLRMTVCELKFDFHELAAMFFKIVSAFPFRTLRGLLIVTMILSLQTDQAQKDDRQTNSLLECGAAQQIVETRPRGKFTFVSYNIRWRSGKELDQIINWLKERSGSTPMIIGLQE